MGHPPRCSGQSVPSTHPGCPGHQALPPTFHGGLGGGTCHLSRGEVPSVLALPLWRSCSGCAWGQRALRPGGLGQRPGDAAGGEPGPHGLGRSVRGRDQKQSHGSVGWETQREFTKSKVGEEPALITCLPTISTPVPSACPAGQMPASPTLSSDRPRVGLGSLRGPPKAQESRFSRRPGSLLLVPCGRAPPCQPRVP